MDERLLNVHNPLVRGQRSIGDVLLRITYRDRRPSTTAYFSPGKAEMALRRYSRMRFVNDSRLPYMVERVN